MGTGPQVGMDLGTHSPWVIRLLKELGREVPVANPRRPHRIYQCGSTRNRVDAGSWARVTRMDPLPLSPVTRRQQRAAEGLAVLRSRDVLVRTRMKLRGLGEGNTIVRRHDVPALCPDTSPYCEMRHKHHIAFFHTANCSTPKNPISTSSTSHSNSTLLIGHVKISS